MNFPWESLDMRFSNWIRMRAVASLPWILSGCDSRRSNLIHLLSPLRPTHLPAFTISSRTNSIRVECFNIFSLSADEKVFEVIFAPFRSISSILDLLPMTTPWLRNPWIAIKNQCRKEGKQRQMSTVKFLSTTLVSCVSRLSTSMCNKNPGLHMQVFSSGDKPYELLEVLAHSFNLCRTPFTQIKHV